MPEIRPLQAGEPREVAGFRLLGGLGDGGQGTVYLAEASDDTLVAVKVLHARLLGNERAIRRFLKEGATAEKVAGFCTAKVIESGLVDGRPYLVSEYIDGPSLQDLVMREGPRESGALVRLAVGTATALSAIHVAGIVHRDFKPSNVLMGPGGPRVIDFGIARTMDSITTATSTVVGTPGYMAPEQIAGEGATSASDMFAWASTMAFAATASPLFGRDSIPAVMNRILNAEPDLSGIPAPLRGVLKSCLSKKPVDRPTADEVLAILVQRAGEEPRVRGGRGTRTAHGDGAGGPKERRARKDLDGGPDEERDQRAPEEKRDRRRSQEERDRRRSQEERDRRRREEPRVQRGGGRWARGPRSAKDWLVGAGVAVLVGGGVVAGAAWSGGGVSGTGAELADEGGSTEPLEEYEATYAVKGEVTAMAVGSMAGGKVVAIADDATESIVVWSPETGRTARSLAGAVRSRALSMEMATVGGAPMVVWSDESGVVRRWRMGSAKADPFTKVCAKDARITVGTWKGRQVAAAGCPDGRVQAVDLATGKTLGNLTWVKGAVTGLAWGEGGTRLAVGSRTGQVVVGGEQRFVASGPVKSVAVLEGGRVAATVGVKTTVRTATGKSLRTLPGALVVARDPKRIITAGNGMDVWDALTGENLVQVLGPDEMVAALAVDDGTFAAAVDGRVRAWRLGADRL